MYWRVSRRSGVGHSSGRLPLAATGYETVVNKAVRQVERVARQQMDIRLTPLQRRALESVLAGRDTMVVSQTGSGKSAVYQLAGALLEGTTVVVSPLIALQEDQRSRFDDMDIGDAVAINSLHGRRSRACRISRFRRRRIRRRHQRL